MPEHAHVQPEHIGYAKTNFDDAVDQLVGTRTAQFNGQTRVRESRYAEILGNLEGQQGTANGSIARSLPPLWIDAHDFLRDVDQTVHDWIMDNRAQTTTPDRLYSLTEMTWRPQDLEKINSWADKLKYFVRQADKLLEPEEHSWELVAECPACSTKTVHRKDAAGEYVRQAALTVTALGCTCQHCKTFWAPEYFAFLARTLGCDLPDGVIDGISTGVAGEIR